MSRLAVIASLFVLVGCHKEIHYVHADGGAEAESAPGRRSPSGGGEGGGTTEGSGLEPEPPPGPGLPGCPRATVDTSAFPWKSPRVQHGACSSYDLDDLVAHLASNGQATPAQLRAQLAQTSPACADCVFAPNGPTWAPLVLTAAGEIEVLNVGGCIALASGSDACGEAYQTWFDCRFAACDGCADPDASRTCLAGASQGACKPAVDDVLTVCGAGIEDFETACAGDTYSFEGPIRAQCIGP